LKNITLSADSEMIRKAREKAQNQRTTLNSVFRQWLERYTGGGSNASEFDAVMKRLRYAKPGRKRTRDEMNER
jgi:hypothetical protein